MGPLYHELTKNKLGVTVVESFLKKLHIDDAGLYKGRYSPGSIIANVHTL